MYPNTAAPHVITTLSPSRKRQMVLVPEVNARSFQFFFEKGHTGYSYSLRDYSVPNHVTERYARDFGWTADELRRKAVHTYDAPFLDVRMLSEWHSYTVELNRQHGLHAPVDDKSAAPVGPGESRTEQGVFPLLNAATFYGSRKAAKTGDLRRMLSSPQSEDWVTWNLLNLALTSWPGSWWTQILARAKKANSALEFSGTATPHVRFWRTVPSPKEYEARSREIMRKSADPIVAARSREPRSVEGDSEIDLIFESPSFLIYVEVKLDSDISMHTTYDPDRNQIARNIDCLLESASGRTPFFWMFVRDASQGRAYARLMTKYREDPKTLSRDLPHRDPALLQKVAQGLTIITWRDIAQDICAPRENDDELLSSVRRELWRRIQ